MDELAHVQVVSTADIPLHNVHLGRHTRSLILLHKYARHARLFTPTILDDATSQNELTTLSLRQHTTAVYYYCNCLHSLGIKVTLHRTLK